MKNFQHFVDTIQTYQAAFFPALPGRRNHRKAGILVPILRDSVWTCILTLRPATLHTHSGEICFPGGKPDPSDRNLQDTALREANEEIGIQNCQIIGRLSSMPLYTSDYRLEPFVGVAEPQNLQANPTEVETIIPISLLHALQLSHIDGIPFQLAGEQHLSPIFDLHRLMSQPPTITPIYGGTAHVLYELLQLIATSLGQQTPPLRSSKRRLPFMK